MCLSQQILEFLQCISRSTEKLDIKLTKQINTHLNPYWQGTTSKINWQTISGNSKKVIFPEAITKLSVNELIKSYAFKALTSDKLVLYYSGYDVCFVIDSHIYHDFLYEIMDRFSFLDSLLLFSYNDIRLVFYCCFRIMRWSYYYSFSRIMA